MTDLHDPRFATTLARGLSVLRAFRVGDDGLSNAEIAQRTGLPKSTVSRLTFTLGHLGYLVQSPRDDRFRPGPTLVAVGHVAATSLSFLIPAHDLMQRLAEETGTLVVLAVRDGDKLVLIRTWRPRYIASIWLEVGQRISLQPFSSARAFIAAATTEAPASSAPPPPPIDGYQDPEEEFELLVLEHGCAGQHDGLDRLRALHRNAHELAVYQLPVTCGALPPDATAERMQSEIGPRLAEAVRSLERMTGQAPHLTRSET